MNLSDRRLTMAVVVKVALAAAVAGWLVDDWIAAATIGVLWSIWWFLPLADGPPVLPLALTYHLMQIVLGVFYHALTGREPRAMVASDYRPMVIMSLGCVVAMVAGIRLGHDLLKRRAPVAREGRAISWQILVVVYVMALVLKGGLERLAWSIPTLNQGLLALGFLRLGLFYILLRRFVRAERYAWGGVLIAAEIAVGLSGFFADFRDPLFIAAVVLLEVFDSHRGRDWALAAGLALVSVTIGALWMGIRTDVRERITAHEVGSTVSDRLELVSTLARSWASSDSSEKMRSVDDIVDRLWDVYYPALAVARVPSVLPHENGAILAAAIRHIVTPRLLFPDKVDLESDSMLVRKYAGVWVAGPEQSTSIAFGYAVQSYIDFGVPGMFVPVFAFGLLVGVAFRWLTTSIVYREVAVASVTVIFWLAVSPYNRAWARMLGLTGTLIIYIGGAALLIDRYLRLGPQDSTVAGEEPEWAQTAQHGSTQV